MTSVISLKNTLLSQRYELAKHPTCNIYQIMAM